MKAFILYKIQYNRIVWFETLFNKIYEIPFGTGYFC